MTGLRNKMKSKITRRNKFFQKWTKFPVEKNRSIYKNQRNMVTTRIKNAKRQSNYDKLGKLQLLNRFFET